ncbi:UNVERIFIED_CONTAM: hypothetical protein K2H54_028358 [Gekko kuhli]
MIEIPEETRPPLRLPFPGKDLYDLSACARRSGGSGWSPAVFSLRLALRGLASRLDGVKTRSRAARRTVRGEEHPHRCSENTVNIPYRILTFIISLHSVRQF